MSPNRLLRYLAALAPIGILALSGALVVAFAGSNGNGRGDDRADDRVQNSDTSIEFRNDVRKLWEDHVVWTRLAIISIVDERPDQDAAVERLLQNQVDIGDAIKPYYGDDAGDGLTSLLHDHITIAAELLVAAKSGDAAAFDEVNARWYANGNDIAAFLNSANPDEWPLAHMEQMMKTHLDVTLQEAVARLQGDYDADVAAYDQVHIDILEMADMLSLGIINQFPERFR